MSLVVASIPASAGLTLKPGHPGCRERLGLLLSSRSFAAGSAGRSPGRTPPPLIRRPTGARPRQCPRPAASLLPAFSLAPLFAADDSWALYTTLILCAAMGMRSEKTKVGAALSGPISTMLLAAILANAGLLPPAGAALSGLMLLLVRVATPLLLLGANLHVIREKSGRVGGAFLVGASGTALGAIMAYAALAAPLGAMGDPGDAWKLAGALAAKNIGGALCNPRTGERPYVGFNIRSLRRPCTELTPKGRGGRGGVYKHVVARLRLAEDKVSSHNTRHGCSTAGVYYFQWLRILAVAGAVVPAERMPIKAYFNFN